MTMAMTTTMRMIMPMHHDHGDDERDQHDDDDGCEDVDHGDDGDSSCGGDTTTNADTGKMHACTMMRTLRTRLMLLLMVVV